MAHSLNNATKARFMGRVSEFSTHGSRRGFVDIPVELPPDQLLNGLHEKREALVTERKALDRRICELKEELCIPPGLSPSDWLQKRKIKQRVFTKSQEKLIEQLRGTTARAKHLQDQLTEINREITRTSTVKDVASGKISQGDLYQRIAQRVLPAKTHHMILEAVERAQKHCEMSTTGNSG